MTPSPQRLHRADKLTRGDVVVIVGIGFSVFAFFFLVTAAGAA
ncbi:MAG: hypothetical protein AAF196_07650 [Planctomycetota bacterium]